jgi:hypothetical protein
MTSRCKTGNMPLCTPYVWSLSLTPCWPSRSQVTGTDQAQPPSPTWQQLPLLHHHKPGVCRPQHPHQLLLHLPQIQALLPISFNLAPTPAPSAMPKAIASVHVPSQTSTSSLAALQLLMTESIYQMDNLSPSMPHNKESKPTLTPGLPCSQLLYQLKLKPMLYSPQTMIHAML